MQHGLELLKKAVASGYTNLDIFRIHPDLDRIGDLPEFRAIVKAL
jgi:hypothetical protein